jgi:hypothetical protein
MTPGATIDTLFPGYIFCGCHVQPSGSGTPSMAVHFVQCVSEHDFNVW